MEVIHEDGGGDDATSSKREKGPKKRKPKLGSIGEEVPELPMLQVKAMFQERMKALMMQDRTRLRKIFEKYDKRKYGSLTLDQFNEALDDFGVEMDAEDAQSFMRRYSSHSHEITFHDFFHRLLGMPQDFFTMDFGREAKLKAKVNDSSNPALKPCRLPDGTSGTAVVTKFMDRLRTRLYDVTNAMTNVMRKGRARDEFTSDDLLDIYTLESIQVTKRELKEIMDHFDLNGNGRVNYYQFCYELLDLPMPKEVRNGLPPSPAGASRTPLSLRGQELVNKLRLLLVSAAARPARIDTLFQQFDKDGSGTVTYDEIKDMVQEFKLEMQPTDGDAASIILTHLDNSTSGMVSYEDFVANTIGVSGLYQHRNKGGKPATSRVREAISSGLKEMMYNNPAAIKKAFSVFDADGQGTVSWMEFRNAMTEIGVLINKKQMRKMFNSFDTEGTGFLNTDAFKSAILGAGQELMAENGSPTRRASPSKRDSIQEDGRSPNTQRTSNHRSSRSGAAAFSGVPPELDAIRPCTGSVSISHGNEASARRAQEAQQANRLREMARSSQSQSPAPNNPSPVHRPLTGAPPVTAGGPPTMRSKSVGEVRATQKHSQRMSQALELKTGRSSNGSRGIRGKLLSPDGLSINNHYATHGDPLLAPSRVGSPNPYLASPLASPERCFGKSMTQEEAREYTMKKRHSKEQARHQAFATRVQNHDQRSHEFEDPGLHQRGASPQTQALVGELRSRDMGLTESMNHSLQKRSGGGMNMTKARSPSRPVTQASMASFGFDGPEALKASKTPQFVPKFTAGGQSPFGGTPDSRRVGQVGLVGN